MNARGVNAAGKALLLPGPGQAGAWGPLLTTGPAGRAGGLPPCLPTRRCSADVHSEVSAKV